MSAHTNHLHSMNPSLKTVAAVLGVALPRHGNISARLGNYRVTAFCGADWARRRKLDSVRLYAIRGTNPDISATVGEGRRIAAGIGFPVDVEAGRMLFRVTPDGQVDRHPRRHVVKPMHKIP